MKRSEINSIMKKAIDFLRNQHYTSGNPQKDVEIEFNDFFRILSSVETDLLERAGYNNEDSKILIKDFKKFYLNFEKSEIKTVKLSVSIKK
jgi:hypothetical protein